MQNGNRLSDLALPTSNKNGFQKFDHTATDVVLAAEFNPSGSHLVVCSADHKIRLFIVRWIDSSLGHAFGTIGDDNKFKLWREDLSQAPLSGRRFRCVFSQSPNAHVSYVSLEFRTLRHEVWLVIISKDGLLSLLEPSEPESLHAWKEIDTMYPFGQHARGLEPIFRLSVHQSERPSYGAISAGLDPRAISVAVSATTSIKVLRATRLDDGNYQFYEMLEISSLTCAINDVSWAPGGIRPYDLLAAACNDGRVRLYMVTTPQSSDLPSTVMGSGSDSLMRERRASSSVARQTLSGIGAGLAGVSRAETTRRTGGGLLIQHAWKEIAMLSHGDGAPVWRVRWTHDGAAVASTGDGGKLHLWKQDINLNFVEFAETGSIWTPAGTLGAMLREDESKISVNNEDILTSRGANPRTGIVSPYFSEESHQVGEENDYIHVRSVRQETTKTTTGAHERWKQDASGWTLIECASDRSSPKAFPRDTLDGGEVIAVSRQLPGSDPASSVRATELDQRTAVTDAFQSATRGSNQIPPKTNTAPELRVTTLSKEICRIPRKQVGSTRTLSMPVSIESSNEGPTYSTKKPRPPLRNTGAGPFLPAHLAAEDFTLGYHAYPSELPRGQVTDYNRSNPQLTVKQSTISDMHESYDMRQRLRRLNVAGTGTDSSITPVAPHLGYKYRRPKHLLPARL
ncbi:MAG: hypothetical protein Q9218_001008 [Villophora microphyllina]